jgi:hypothetical protein
MGDSGWIVQPHTWAANCIPQGSCPYQAKPAPTTSAFLAAASLQSHLSPASPSPCVTISPSDLLQPYICLAFMVVQVKVILSWTVWQNQWLCTWLPGHLGPCLGPFMVHVSGSSPASSPCSAVPPASWPCLPLHPNPSPPLATGTGTTPHCDFPSMLAVPVFLLPSGTLPQLGYLPPLSWTLVHHPEFVNHDWKSQHLKNWG